MIERTRIFGALQGVRGRKPVDLKALEELAVQFSQLVVEQRAIREIDINLSSFPLIRASRLATARFVSLRKWRQFFQFSNELLKARIAFSH